MKLCKFFLYPKLHQHLKLKAQGQHKFECSLDPSEVPDIKAKLSSDEKFYPYVGNSTEQSRKIVTVKTIHEQSGIFVRTIC